MDGLCKACTNGARGENGHESLEFYVGGPYPGHHIYKCAECGERWIRHYGNANERFGWVRYAEQFAMRKPVAIAPREREREREPEPVPPVPGRSTRTA